MGVLALGQSAVAEPTQSKEDERLQRIEKRLASLEGRALKPVGTGYELSLNGAIIAISQAGDIRIESAKSVSVKAGTSVKAEAGADASIKAAAAASIQASGSLTLKGATMNLNGGGSPVARKGDLVTLTNAVAGGLKVTGTGTIQGGSTSVQVP